MRGQKKDEGTDVKKNKETSQKSKREFRSESSEGDVIDLILEDHKPLKELIVVLKDSKALLAKKKLAYEKFASLLATHAEAEEESLYAYMKKLKDFRIDEFEGETEHALAKSLMGEIAELKFGDEWEAKVKVLAEMVEHHVAEEENALFKKLEEEVSDDELESVGQEYAALWQEKRMEKEGDIVEGDYRIRPRAGFSGAKIDAAGSMKGRVGVPILLYFMGVPGGIVLLLWFFVFR